MAIRNSEGDEGAVIVRSKANGPRFYGKWRHPDDRTKQVEVAIGPAWIVGCGEAGAKPNGLTIGLMRDDETQAQRPRWCDRSGSAPDGHLTIRAANRKLPDVYAAWLEAESARQQEQEEASKASDVLFPDAADAWLIEGETVRGWKPTTVTNMKRYLRKPDECPKRRGTKPTARIMREFSEAAVPAIDTAWVKRFLRKLDSDDDLSPRSVNAYRAILLGIFAHAVDEGWCDENPVIAAPKRREPAPGEIVVYSPAQVEAIARRATDAVVAALIRTAAGTGLRLGELLALRWKDVNVEAKRIRVSRSYAAGHGETTPKSRKGRTVPLANNVAAVLEHLRRRDHFTRPNDLVFGNGVGEHLDPWTTRARFYEARDEAIAEVEVGAMEVLTFHSLRHAFCSHLADAGIDVVKIQKWAGHSEITTTMRYLHAVESDEDVDRLSAAVAPDAPLTIAA